MGEVFEFIGYLSRYQQIRNARTKKEKCVRMKAANSSNLGVDTSRFLIILYGAPLAQVFDPY
jgi:hypothetical protein